MGAATLVERTGQVHWGWQLLANLRDAKYPFIVAFWARVGEGSRCLFIATPLVREKGLREALRTPLELLRSLSTSWISTTDLTLIADDDPRAVCVQDALAISPAGGDVPALVSWKMPETLEDVFIYSNSFAVFTIYGIRFPNAPQQFGSVNFSFSPHNPITSLQVGGTSFACEVGIDWQIAAPAGAELFETEFGVRMLRWQLHDRLMESSASEVWHLANLGLHGFRILKTPDRPA